MLSPDCWWPAPPAAVLLGEEDVHVWCARLDQPPATVEALRRCLSPDELSRTGRYRLARDARRFVVGRGVLRQLLGSYLGLSPEAVPLACGPRGKPTLDLPADRPRLTFNLSHSADLALYAIGLGRSVGVDLERVRELPDLDALAARCLSPGERAELDALPRGARLEAFLRCWTCKEAYAKATGEGLAERLDDLEVSPVPGEPARLRSIGGNPEPARRWLIRALSPHPDFVGAVAVEARHWRLSCWKWEGCHAAAIAVAAGGQQTAIAGPRPASGV